MHTPPVRRARPLLYTLFALCITPFVLAMAMPAAQPLGVHFTGTITSGGAPVPGVAVSIAWWNAGSVTDQSGRYAFTVATTKIGDRVTIAVQALGFTSLTRDAVVTADTMRVDFELQAAPLALQELGVVGGRARSNAAVAPAMAPPPPGTFGLAYRRPLAARSARGDFNTESYSAIEENPFLAAPTNPLSTFSIDVDRASYANVRRFLREGRLPPKDAVRIEELVNYFTYEDPAPKGAAPLSIRTELAPAPWKPAHQLLRIGLRARTIEHGDAPPANLVFLIDVSGSMQSPDKLPLVKQAFGLLVNELRPADRVAIVVYAGATGLALPSTPGNRKEEIMSVIERLEAGGTTAGGAGLRLAYDVAQQNFIKGGNNRVILATDGDFNVGVSDDAAMRRLVEEKRAQSTFLSVLGFGTGNLKDSKMETLADHGNGNYAYIDDIAEARKVFVHELGGTLVTVAKDVKIQVEFNPARVRGYRLIGYENRMLAAEDFKDDRKDAGELGSGHSVTALYEIVPVGAKTDVELRTPDGLRYQQPPAQTTRSNGRELAFVKLRYKQPDGDKSVLLEQAVRDRVTDPSTDFTFAAAVAGFGMVLRDSPHRGSASFESVSALARASLGSDRGGYRAGFLELVEAARRVGGTIATQER